MIHKSTPSFLFLAMLLWVLSHPVWAQTQSPTPAGASTEPQLRIEAGMHTSAIWRIATDAAGRYAVTASADKTARVWDVTTGRLLQVLRPPIGAGDEGKLYAVALSPDGHTVAVGGITFRDGGATRFVYLFDRSTGQLRQQLASQGGTIFELAYSPDERYLAAGTLSGIQVWPLNNKKGVDFTAPLLMDLSYGDRSEGVAWVGSDRLASTSYDGKVRLYQVTPSTMQLLHQSTTICGQRPKGIAWSASAQELAVSCHEAPKVAILSGQDLSLRHTPDVGGIEFNVNTIAWSANGQHLVAGGRWANKGQFPIRVWSQAGRGAYTDVPIGNNSIFGLATLPNQSVLVGAADPLWGILNLQSANPTWQPQASSPSANLRLQHPDKHPYAVLSTDGTTVQFGFNGNKEVHRFNVKERQLQSGQAFTWQTPRITGLDIQQWYNGKPSLAGKLLDFNPLEISRSLAIANDSSHFVLGSSWYLYRFAADGKRLWRKQVPGEVRVVVLPEQKEVVLAMYTDGTIRWHRLSDGKELLALFLHADRKRWVLWTPSGYYDAAAGSEDLIGWHVNRYQPSTHPHLQISPVVLYTVSPNTAAAEAGLQANDAITHFNGQTLTSQAQLGALIRKTPEGGSITLTIQRNGEVKQIKVTPKTTANDKTPRIGTSSVLAHEPIAADFFPVSQFRSRFHRPDVIDRVLETMDEAQAFQQADTARGVKSSDAVTPATAAASVFQALPPVVDVLSGTELRATSAHVTLRVRARTAADAQVTGWSVRVNGQLQPDAGGPGRTNPANGDEREITVTVPAQDSEIQVFATNRHAASTPAVVRVTWAGAAPVAAEPAAQAAGFQIQPKLYILAVGVAQYQHPSISKLDLPAKDARDFVATLQAQKGKLYREVEVKLLTDAQATADAVIDGLEWLQRQVTQHDIGMVFLAGHGVNDATQGYIYLPVNADPDRLRRTGVPMDEFKKTLAALPGKAVFFFDTCHSGSALGNSKSRSTLTHDVTAVVNELSSAENGVVVFSSSTGRQLSYEDPAWGNGAFTKAVVEGLNGKANYQNTGRITHKMLDLYISERVKQLTDGKQSPVTQAPGGVPDFPLAVVR